MKKMKSMVAWMLVLAMVCTNVEYVRATTIKREDPAPVGEVENAYETEEEAAEVVEIVERDGADESVSVPAVNATTGENIASGTWRGMDWVIDADGVLTIAGVYSYEGSEDEEPVWTKFSSSVSKVNVTAKEVKSTYYWFYNIHPYKGINFTDFDTNKVTNMSHMFDGCWVYDLNLSNFDTSAVTDMSNMFEDCCNLRSLDLSNFDTSQVINMEFMFSGCKELNSLDLRSFDTSRVTNMSWMFRSCYKLVNLNVSGFDTSQVTDMTGMFEDCCWLSDLDVSCFNTSRVESMDKMFYNCGVTSLDVSGFNLDNVHYMYDMFVLSNLKKVKVFKELHKDVRFPSFRTPYMYDVAGNEYTSFPMDLSESIWIYETKELARSANQFKLCAYDSATKQLIQDAHIIVDGVDYKVNSKGYVTLTVDAEDTTEHAIHAVANGYMQKPYQMLQIKGGGSYTFYLDSMSDATYSSYIVGVLKNEVDLDDGKIKIDDSWYKCSVAVNSDLYGKTVVGFLVDDTITDLRNAEDYYVLASSVPSGGRTFVYQNGAYNVPYMLTTFTFESKLSNSDIKFPASVTGEKTITNISVKAGSNLRIALSETGSYQESVVISNANQKINANQSYKLNIYVKPREGYVPEQNSAYDTVRFSVTYDDGKELSFYRTINFSNGDVAAEKKSTRMNSDSNTTLKNVKANLDSNLLFDAYIFKTTLGMSNAEVKSINELLTAWVLSLDAATDTVNELTQDEKMLQQVLKKMGVNIPKFDWLTGSKSSATIQVEVQTSGFGKVVLLFTYDGLEYHWDRKEPFAKSAVIYWQVYKSDKQVPNYLMEKRTLDMYVKADTDQFYTQIRSLAMDAIKDCYNQWGGNADKVAEEIIDKRILALVNYKFKSTSNMVFTLISNPAKSTAGYKLCKASCPVDLYVYDAEGKLVGSLVDDVAYPVHDGVVVYMDGETKVVLCCNDSYTIQFVGNGTGTMQYVVREYDSTGEQIRELQYHDVPLTDGIVYKESIPEEINVSPERFDLIKENGEAITASSDTMPPEEKIVRAEGIQLDQTSLVLTTGDETVLAATLEPTDATIQDVVWSSSDEAILTVKDGKISALAAGEAEVTATAVDGMYSAVCTVTVQAKTVPVTAVALDKSTLSLKAKEIATLTATLSPADATDKTVTWSSSDDKVATVDDSGKVTAIAKGTVTITATTKDGNFTASCTVTVTEEGDGTGGSTDEPTDETTDKPGDDSEVKQDTSRTFVLKQKQDITAFFTAATPYKKYTVTPKGAATVTSKGILTAKKPAETLTVTGLVKDGKQWKEAESVTFKIEKPAITAKTITATRAGITIDAATNISGTTLQPSSWLSSKPAVAEIDAKTGLITTKTKGTAKITAVYGEGKNAAKYTFNVKVSIPVMSKTKATLLTGGILQLKLRNMPKTGAGTGGAGTSGMAESTVLWSSSDAKSVTVDDTGKVTVLSYNGKTAGKATITATYDGVSYSCEIEVKKPELKKTSLTMKQGKAQKLTFKNTKLKNAKWTSLNEKVATVDDTGRVTGVSKGTAKIQAIVGGVTCVCEVTVE